MSFSTGAIATRWASMIAVSLAGILTAEGAIARSSAPTATVPTTAIAQLDSDSATSETILPHEAATAATSSAPRAIDTAQTEDAAEITDEPESGEDVEPEGERPPTERDGTEDVDDTVDPDAAIDGDDPFAPLPDSSPAPPLPRLPDELRSPVQPPETLINTGLSSYVLGPGDQIGVAVVGFEDLERVRIVLPDGTILLPLIGPVVAAGKTLEDLEQEITRRLSFFLVDPVVELNLPLLRPVVVTVGGDVNRPGPVQLDSLSAFDTPVLETGTTAPTLSSALARAGGVRRTADLRNITVQRRLPDGNEVTLAVNLWDALFQGGDNDNILLQDGDIVFVPEAPEGSELNPQLVARSSLAPDVVRVRVIGEVTRPGEIEIPPTSSVSGAVAAAGGHTPESADLSNVALLRLADNGQVEEQRVDLGNIVDSTPIQDGDVIVVPKRGFLNTLDNISRTVQPITAPFNFLLLLDRVFFN